MVFIMGMLFGLGAMVAWGLTDYFNKNVVEELGNIRLLFWQQLISLPVFAAMIFFFALPAYNPLLLGISFFSGILMTFSLLFFFKALSVGKVSLILPICASYGSLTALLSVVFLGEALSPLQKLGIGVITCGIILISTDLSELKKARLKTNVAGIGYALATFVLWAIVFTLYGWLYARMHWFYVHMASSITATILVSLILFIRRIPLVPSKTSSPPARTTPTKLFVTLSGVLSIVGMFSYAIGVSLSKSALVAPISALFPAVTIVLAYFYLGERMAKNQWAGVVLSLAGVVLLSL